MPSLNQSERDETIKNLRARLDKLNRSPVKKPPAGSTLNSDVRRTLNRQKRSHTLSTRHDQKSDQSNLKPILYRRDLPREASMNFAYSAAAPVEKVILNQAVTGREIIHEKRGAVYLVETSVKTVDESPDVDRLFNAKIASLDNHLLQRLRNAHNLPAFAPADFIFTDIETTGLSNSPLFLIGIMVWQGGGLVVRQYLARTYAEEAAAISFFLDECKNRKMIITFNGKTFDYPYIKNRAIATGIAITETLPHFDLLHECRRIWKATLPDCKLQTLERYVCNRTRFGDIPGHLIPQAYHDFVRTENAWQMVEILKHNMLDLVTLGELMGRWPEIRMC